MKALTLILVCAPLAAQTREQPVRSVTDPGVVTTRQAITPAGTPSVFSGRLYGAVFGPSGEELWVLHASDLYRLDWRGNRVLARIPHNGTPGAQAIGKETATGAVLIATSAAEKGGGAPRARLGVVADGKIRVVAAGLGSYQPGAFAVAEKPDARGRRVAVVPLVYENRLLAIDLETGARLASIETETAPFAAVVNREGSVAYVSNLGGRPPKPGELFASPARKPDERVPVDGRGIASTGTVTRVDLAAGKPVRTIAAGLHPTSMYWDHSRRRLYVANGNSDTVSVIDTSTDTVVRTIELQPFRERVRGVAPTAVTASPGGGAIFVACGGINAVAVVDAATGRLRGLIPTGWYPNGVAVSPDGKHLAVTSLLGAGSGWREAPPMRFVHSYRGSVAVIPIPSDSQLANYTTAVAENNRLRLAEAEPRPAQTALRAAKPVAIPVRSGEPSLIEHVVFIIKENRTYDQILGDMPQGNGDPSLAIFGRQVTPNQHRLAEQFVLLDNLYATGGNSADGHQWLTQANETEYCLWPGYQGRSYPFDGSDPMAYSHGGFLWDYALARGKSVRVYGEYAGRMTGLASQARLELLKRWERGEDFAREWSIRAPIEPLNKILAAQYPSYTTVIPDVARARIFLADLKRFQQEGRFPNLVLLQLPSNHTAGTTPGVSTPKAMVADNDLAVGQIVEALSKSRFWPKMAIFIVEDDAQNGVDHVDGHRTTAFLASPYARRGVVDSTFYSQQSILKTIELILGLPTMSLFDLIANDMRHSFVDTPDFTPCTAVRPAQDLFEINPPLKALKGAAREAAVASAKMNWAVPDAAPTDRLNRILWGAIKGWQAPYPGTRQAVFSPLSLDLDDDEREQVPAPAR